MKRTILILVALGILSNATVADAKPKVNTCINIKEEVPSKKTIIKKFPEFNIQLILPINTNAVKRKDGSILLVDRGTYRYLRCLQNNPHGLGKGIIGVLIKKGTKDYPVNNPLLERPSASFIATPNYNELGLRFTSSKGSVDISFYGSGPVETEEEAAEEVKELLEVTKSLTFLSR